MLRKDQCDITRHQAKSILPSLGVLFKKQLPLHHPPRVNEFCRRIVVNLQSRSSEAFILTESWGFHELLDANLTPDGGRINYRKCRVNLIFWTLSKTQMRENLKVAVKRCIKITNAYYAWKTFLPKQDFNLPQFTNLFRREISWAL